MVYAVMQDMPEIGETQYRLVEQHLGPDRPPGLLVQVSGPYEHGWRIIAVWADESDYQRFRAERLGRAAGLAAQHEEFDPSKAAGFRSWTVTGDDLPFR